MPSSIFVQSSRGAKKVVNASNHANNTDMGFSYSSSNNIFVDLKRLQQAMVIFYALPSHGEKKNDDIFPFHYLNDLYLLPSFFCSVGN